MALPILLWFRAKILKTKRAQQQVRDLTWTEYHRSQALEKVEIKKDFEKGPIHLLPRPRTLTLRPPSPSDSSQSSGIDDVQKQPILAHTEASFFTKLPPDIRLKIYEELLGTRTVHVESEHCQRKTPDPRYSAHRRHYGLQRSLQHGEYKCPTAWTWWHCVCHRRDPEMSPLDDCIADGLWHTARDHLYLEIHSGEHGDCKLEIAMLFTCRQA